MKSPMATPSGAAPASSAALLLRGTRPVEVAQRLKRPSLPMMDRSAKSSPVWSVPL